MKKLIFSIFLLSFVISINAQEQTEEKAKVKMTSSPAYENDKSRTFIRSMMRDREGNIFIIKNQYKVFGKPKLLVEKYSPELKQKFSKELVISGTEGKDMDYLSATSIGGEPCVFSSFYNKDKDTRYLFVSKILEKGLLGKPQKISSYEADRKYDGAFELYFSKDSAKILVVNMLETKKKEKAKFSYVVLDNQFQEIWKAEVTMPFETRDVVLSDFAVDGSSRVFALATADNEEKGKDEASVIQELFMYENGAGKPKRYNLELKGKLVSQLRLHESLSGDLVAVGSYASSRQKKAFFSRDRTSPLGTIFVKINRETGELGAKSVNQFSKKTFDFMNVKPSKIEDGKGIDYMRLENSWVNGDGSICLDLEQNHVVITTRQNGSFTSTTYHYYSQMAMLVKYDADGKVQNEVIVPKRMQSINDETGLRHIVSHSGSEVYFVYNDSPKNWGKKAETEDDIKFGISPESGGISFKKKPHVVLCTVDENGKKKFARLFNFKDDDVFLNTEASLPYSDKSFIVVASYNKDFKLMKIAF